MALDKLRPLYGTRERPFITGILRDILPKPIQSICNKIGFIGALTFVGAFSFLALFMVPLFRLANVISGKEGDPKEHIRNIGYQNPDWP